MMSGSVDLLTATFPILVFNALEIIGFYTVTHYKQLNENSHEPDEGSKMALWRIKYYSLKVLGTHWSKPVCTCPPCMASLHSLVFWLFIPFSATALVIYILYMLALSGTVQLLAVMFKL